MTEDEFDEVDDVRPTRGTQSADGAQRRGQDAAGPFGVWFGPRRQFKLHRRPRLRVLTLRSPAPSRILGEQVDECCSPCAAALGTAPHCGGRP